MVTEIWKDIEGCEEMYQVSNKGRVKSLFFKREKILKFRNHRGYLKVGLYKNKIMKYTPVHRIIANAFIANQENKPCVNHINGIKTDNKIENLEWCTIRENNNHAFKTQLKKSGEEHLFAKLSKNEVIIIRKLCDERKFTKSKIARWFGVGVPAISKIHLKQTWKHI